MFKFSAEDIANQSFQSRFRGYDPDQVHEFLDGLAREWGEIQRICKEMKEEMEHQSRELRDFRRRESGLVQAMEMARQVAEEIRHQADRDAELVLADTELKAERMLARAEQKVSELRNELFELQQKRHRFHSEMRNMLENYSDLFRHYEARSDGADQPLPPIPGAHKTSEIDDDDVMSDEEGLVSNTLI